MSIWRSHGTAVENRWKYSTSEDDDGDEDNVGIGELRVDDAARTTDDDDDDWCCDDRAATGNPVSPTL